MIEDKRLIYILSRNRNLYSTKRLVEEVEAMGWECRVLDYLKCTLDIVKGKRVINYNGKTLDKPDAIIPRIGASRTFFGNAVIRQFESMGVFSTTSSLSLSRSRDKLRSIQILSRNVDIPKTVFASNKSKAEDVINLAGGTPLIMKVLEGTQGKGVVLVDSKMSAKSVLDAFNGLEVNILIQEFIREADGEDIRVFVVDGKVVGAMKRKAKDKEFRSNLHQGGTSIPHKVKRNEKSVAIQSALAMGLGICGVDIINSARGPLVLEVNSSPGLEGIEKTTGFNIAGEIMSYIDKHLKIKDRQKRKRIVRT